MPNDARDNCASLLAFFFPGLRCGKFFETQRNAKEGIPGTGPAQVVADKQKALSQLCEGEAGILLGTHRRNLTSYLAMTFHKIIKVSPYMSMQL